MSLTGHSVIASADEIDALDVLGMLIWRMQHPGSIPPAFLCLSKEARGRNRQLAANTVETVRAEERQRQEARDAGNPRAFFCGEVKSDETDVAGGGK